MSANEPIGTLEVDGRTFQLYTIPSYVTAYFYVRELGSVQHFETLARLKNAIRRAVKAGKIK